MPDRRSAEPGAECPDCPLCGRPITAASRSSLHHLVPRLKGGKGRPVVRLHQICHDEVHASLTEAELARGHATVEALRAHPRLARFIAWIAKRPPEFHSVPPGPRRGPRRRRRSKSGIT